MMSGKTQRRKANAQCASSSKAAELLQNTGNLVPLLGLEGLQIPSLESGEFLTNEFETVSPEIRIVLKKLSKRDAMTREKGIKGIMEYVEKLSPSELKPLFACFSTIYPRIVTDGVAMIRAASNNVLALFLKALRRDAEGTALKTVMPFLIFSLGDVHNARRSAERLLEECFDDDKRKILFKTFAKPTINLALEIVNRKHQLVQPQQAAAEETDAQRQSRLISQSLVTMELLLGEDKKLSALLIQNFTQPSTIIALTKISTNIKTAFFSLLKSLVQIDAEPFFDSKILTLIFSNLDDTDVNLCQNSFECFLTLAANEKFHHACKFEKAVVPKFLAMIRKKSTHWNVLGSSLLPSFAIICNSLSDESTHKWIFSSINSFFEGELPGYLIPQWSAAFVEVVRFSIKSYGNKAEILSFLLKETLQFIDFIVEKSPHDESVLSLVADFVVSISEVAANVKEFKRDICSTILNKLPQSFYLTKILLQKWDDKTYQLNVIEHPDIPDELLIMSLENDIRFVRQNMSNIGDFLLRRTCESTSFKAELLQILCTLITEHNVKNLLESFVKDNPANCCLFLNVPPYQFKELFGGDSCANIVIQIINGVLSRELPMPSGDESQSLIRWILDLENFYNNDHNTIKISQLVLDICLKAQSLSDFLVELYNEFLINNKISIKQEQFIASKLFEYFLTEHSHLLNHDLARNLFSRLKININEYLASLKEFLEFADTDTTTIAEMASAFNSLKFLNASASQFFPSLAEIKNLADELERKFLLDILLEDNSFLFSFVPARPNLFALKTPSKNEKCYESTDLFKFLCENAKYSLFVQQLLKGMDNQENSGESFGFARAFIWLAATFVKSFCSSTFSMEDRKVLAEFSNELDKIELTEEHLLEILKVFLPENDEYEGEICIPISVVFALRILVRNNGAKFANLNEFLKSTVVMYCPSLAFAFALNFSASSVEMPILLEQSLSIVPSTSGTYPSTNSNSRSFENADKSEASRLFAWLYEFERVCAVFTSENRAENYITLATFVERKEFNDWLFTLQSNNPLRDALSCVLLRLSIKVAPYMAEVDGPIRDFINCGFITALQSCTDNILSIENIGEHVEFNPLLFALAQLSLQLFVVYENCIALNAKNVDYVEIKQEWMEFFAPSAVNFIFAWFLNLARNDRIYPPFFTLELCRVLHFLEFRRIFGAELLVTLDTVKLLQGVSKTYFEGYPSTRCKILSATARLLLSERAEIQLAAAKILQSHLLSMFDLENRPISANAKKDVETSASSSNQLAEASNFIERLDVGGEDDENEVETHLPKFLTALFLRDYPQRDVVQTTVYKPYISVELLAWEAFVRFVSGDALDVPSRVHICDAFSARLVDASLERLLAALPDLPLSSSQLHEKSSESFFTHNVDFYYMQVYDHKKFVCNLYYRSLTTVPALVRQWYLSLTKNIALEINKYTRKHVSPAVVRHEISQIGDRISRRFGRLEVRVMSAVNEVAASYHFDDATISLHIALPDDFPLTLAAISTQRKIVREDLHRKWLLQLEKFLSHENGSLLEGILQWKRNIDKHLEGVEDCTICMLTISLTNHQLPRIRCRQCRNKFHGDCLYKWFKTSSNTSCPLCRANFVR